MLLRYKKALFSAVREDYFYFMTTAEVLCSTGNSFSVSPKLSKVGIVKYTCETTEMSYPAKSAASARISSLEYCLYLQRSNIFVLCYAGHTARVVRSKERILQIPLILLEYSQLLLLRSINQLLACPELCDRCPTDHLDLSMPAPSTQEFAFLYEQRVKPH